MPPYLALFLCFLFVLWLFKNERKVIEPVSAALWLPLAWAFILGSRPVSQWLGLNPETLSPADIIEGSPLDRAVLFALIGAGLIVLLRRRASLSEIVWNNKWVFIFYLYLAVSVLWSDYSFISFKRWIKDLGNVVMALVVLSEINPIAAIKSLMLRCIYLLIPFSVVAIKYFPSISRSYNQWDYTVYLNGIAGDKNLLGMSLFVAGVSLVYVWLTLEKKEASQKHFRFGLLLLVLMTLWLLVKAHSATALVCTLLASSILLLIRSIGVRKFMAMAIALAIIVGVAFTAIDMSTAVGKLLGRNTTLTGRTDIWNALLQEKTNPLFGVGFYSFWMGGRAEKLSEKYHYALNEAHNGYLETYLNSGFIGVFLLLTLIVLSLRSAWRNSKGGDLFEVYRAAFLLGIIGYNVTEATFNRLSLIWFAFLMVTLSYPHNPQSAPELIEYKESNRRMRILGRSPAPQLGFRPRAGKFPVK